MNIKNQVRKSTPLLFAFLLPMASYLLAMLCTDQPPFGNNALLISDCYHQYYPFLLKLRSALLSGESLQWTWSLGMGSDHIGLLAYYCASPLNILAIFLPESWLLSYFCLLTPLKLSLASLSMAYFLNRLYQRSDWALPFFGCLYAFCGWSLLYSWNVMWLDGVALLPLVVWSTIRLLRDKKITPYILAIAATLMVNYYIAIFACTFVLLLFICYEYYTWQDGRKLRRDLLRISLATAFAFCIASMILLPVISGLSGSLSQGYIDTPIPHYLVSVEDQKEATKLWAAYHAAAYEDAPRFGLLVSAIKATLPLLWEAISKIICHADLGTFAQDPLASPPATYSGIFVMVLVFAALISKDKARKEKIAYLSLIGFYLLGMLSNSFGFIIHGFHYPAQLPFRFTFIVSFIAIATAYPMWLQKESISPWRVLAAGTLTAVFLLLSGQFRAANQRDINLAVIGLFTSGLVLFCKMPRKKTKTALDSGEAPDAQIPDQPADPQRAGPVRISRRGVATFVTAFVLVLEAFLAPVFAAKYQEPNAVDMTSMTQAQANLASMQAAIKDQELFYRTELTQVWSCNDGAYFNYNSPSAFSSSINDKTTNFLIALGADCSVRNNRAYLGNGSPVANLFVALKYLASNNNAAANNPLFELAASDGDMTLYRNKAYLPLCFMAGKEILALTFEETTKNSFQFQNQLFSAATGIQAPVYEEIPAGDWQIPTQQGVTVTPEEVPGRYTIQGNGTGDPGTVAFIQKTNKAGSLTLCIGISGGSKEYTVSRNGEIILIDQILDEEMMVSVGTVAEGDEIRVEFICPKADKMATVSLSGAVLDLDLFMQGYDRLSSNPLILTEFTNTRVAGTIYCQEAGLLYTSIPQDGNWTAYIDGCEAEAHLLGNAMICLELEEGTHTVEFRYSNRSFQVGLWVSASAVAALIVIALARKLRKMQEASPATEREPQ